MFEDYVAGALLLIAAWMAIDGRAHARTVLVVAWAYYAGLMGSSCWGQLEGTLRGTEMEPNNGAVLSIKLTLWSIGVVSLVRAFQGTVRDARPLPYRGEF